MSDDHVYMPWIEDPDAPDEVQIMTPAESKAAANKLAEMFPELVQKEDGEGYKPTAEEQAAVWATAIDMIDETEPMIRELIEVELYGPQTTRTATRKLDRVLAHVRQIRAEAIRRAFQYLKDNTDV